jgi:hypothetical protein
MYCDEKMRIFDDIKTVRTKQFALVLFLAALTVFFLNPVAMAADPIVTTPSKSSRGVKSSSSPAIKAPFESGSTLKTHPIPILKSVTTLPLTMTGFGNVTDTANTPFTPKTTSTATLMMTGQGAGATASVPVGQFTPKTATTAKLTMTGQGN